MKAKKLLTLFVAILTALTLCVSFVACGSDKKSSSCKHNWTEATCTEPARCTLCNKTNGKAAGHKYDESTVAATCDYDGLKINECSVCHDKTTEVLPRLAHQYVPAVTSELACETDEITTYTCKLCDVAYSEVTERHKGHNTEGLKWTEDKSKEERVSECEYIVTETAKCNDCKEDIERTYHKHVYQPVVKRASCKDGTVQYSCVCENPEYDYTEVLPVSPEMHNWVSTSKAGATHECVVCGATKSEIKVKGDSATISASQLAGKNNIAITTGNSVMLQPDATLTGKMSSGVEVVTEEVGLPNSVKGEDAELLANATVYNFELNNTNGNKIDFGTGKMTVSVPYEDDSYDYDPSSVVACYIDDNGNVKYQQATFINDVATFDAEHFSHYTVVRLTPAQRCAKLGHSNVETVIAATCTQDGYITYSCKRCGNFERKNGDKKLGHDYASSVIASTCADKGYTLMTCKHEGCDESYITKYTAVLPHSYTDNKVAATCTAKGYTEHTCSNCGGSYRDSYTDMIAHTYNKGVCKVCGKSSTASAADNFYINFINSIKNIDSYYVDLSDADIKLVLNDSSRTNNTSIVINTYKLSVGIDADGYLVGSGEGKAKVTEARVYKKPSESSSPDYSDYEKGVDTLRDDEAPTVSDQSFYLAFKNKKIYVRTTVTYAQAGTKEVYDEYSVMSQDDAELGDIKQYVNMYYSAPVKKVVGILLDGNAKNSPLNDGIAQIMDYLFDKKESAGGYTLTLNYDHVAEAVEYANTHTAAEVFDAIVGEGKFDELVKFAQDAPDMTLSEFIAKVTDIATKFGLKINDIYDIIDTVFKTIDDKSTVSALEFVDKNGSKKMSALVEELSGGNIKGADIKATIDNIIKQYVPMLKDTDKSLIELAASYVPVKDEFDFAGYIKTSLDALTAAAKNKINVVIVTDNSGAFESVSVKADNFDYTQNVPVEVARDEDVSFKASGKFSFVITTIQGAIGNNANVVTAIDKAKSAVVDAIKKNVGVKIEDHSYGYTVVSKNGEFALVPYVDATYASNYGYDFNLVERNVTYNGVECDLYTMRMSDDGYIINFDGDFSYSNSCTGWTYNRIAAKGMYPTYYKVYKQGSKVLGVEFDWDTTKDGESYYYSRSAYIYVNAAQGKLSCSQPHKYVLVNKSEDPTECEQTVYDTYRCTACGDLRYDYRTKWHRYEYTYELKPGAKDCSGGIVQVATCKDCKKELSRNETTGVYSDGSHRIVYKSYPVKGAKCDDTRVTVRGCVCGQYVESVSVGNSYDGNDCQFDNKYTECTHRKECKHGYYTHYTVEYQCYVTKCGYTYTQEYFETMPDKNCATKSWSVYTIDGTKYTTTERENTYHDYTSKTSTEGELTVDTRVCVNCNKVFDVNKYDTYGRTVYYYSYASKNGYEIEYDKDCSYVKYQLDESGKRSGQSSSGTEHRKDYNYKITTEGELTVKSYVCLYCNKPIEVEKRDKYDRGVYYYSHEYKYGWERVYDKNCNYVEYALDENQKRGEQTKSGTNHIMKYSSLESKHNCTQPHDYVNTCAACNFQEFSDYFYGHNFVRDYKNGGYKCSDCGMTNDNWAEGPVSLEDLNKGSYVDGKLNIGYHTNCGIKASVEYYTDYDEDGYGTTVSVKATDKSTGEYSGRITIDKAELKKIVDSGKSFTVVFAIRRGFEFDGMNYPTFEIAITFTVEELAEILGL